LLALAVLFQQMVREPDEHWTVWLHARDEAESFVRIRNASDEDVAPVLRDE
jgi:hypothetical protein